MKRVFVLKLTPEQRVAISEWIEGNRCEEKSGYATIGQALPEEGIAKFGFYDETEFRRTQKFMDELNHSRRNVRWLHSRCQHEDTGQTTIIPIWRKCPRRWFRYQTRWNPFRVEKESEGL